MINFQWVEKYKEHSVYDGSEFAGVIRGKNFIPYVCRTLTSDDLRDIANKIDELTPPQETKV